VSYAERIVITLVDRPLPEAKKVDRKRSGKPRLYTQNAPQTRAQNLLQRGRGGEPLIDKQSSDHQNHGAR
jgi:hypothetical protein